MSEPMRGFNAAQRAYDAQEPPEYYAQPQDDCEKCKAEESMEYFNESVGLDKWVETKCSECGHVKREYADTPEPEDT